MAGPRPRKIALTYSCIIAVMTCVLCGCHNRLSMPELESLAPAQPLARLTTAHRGNLNRGTYPDNSIPAIQEAISAQVPLLEVDVRRSYNGELFLFHDRNVLRRNSYAAPSGQGRPIQSLTSEERQRVFLDSNRTIHVPTLTEALDTIRNTQSSLQIDLKQESDDLMLHVLRVISERNQLSQVLLQVRRPSRISVARAAFPKARILARCRSRKALDTALANRVEFVELEGWVTSEAIAHAHNANTKVLINVAESDVDEASTWRYLRSRGVDSLMTDRADLANETLP